MRDKKGRFVKGFLTGYKFPLGFHPKSEIKKGERRGIRTEFKKGMIPWNKGKKYESKFKGDKNHSWRGGRIRDISGYIHIYCPNHPQASKNHVLEHRFVAENKIGRYLEHGEVVHHINGVRDDNRPENLQVLTRTAHSKLHSINFVPKRKYEHYDIKPKKVISGKTISVGLSNRSFNGTNCEKCNKLFWSCTYYKYKTCSLSCAMKKIWSKSKNERLSKLKRGFHGRYVTGNV